MWAVARGCSTTRPPYARRWDPPLPAATAAATARCRRLPQPACLLLYNPPNPFACAARLRGGALVDELQGPATDGRLTVRYLPELLVRLLGLFRMFSVVLAGEVPSGNLYESV